MKGEREVRTIGASLAGAAAAAFGSSEPAVVDRHEATFTGLHGGAVGRAVIWEQAAVEAAHTEVEWEQSRSPVNTSHFSVSLIAAGLSSTHSCFVAW